MPLTVKQWVMTQPVYLEAARERDKLLVEVADLQRALKGAALGHRQESGLLSADIEELRSEREVLQTDLEAVRAENEDLRAKLAALTQGTPKVVAV